MINLKDTGEEGSIAKSFSIGEERGKFLKDSIYDYCVQQSDNKDFGSYQIVEYASSLALNDQEQGFCIFHAGGMVQAFSFNGVREKLLKEKYTKEIPEV